MVIARKHLIEADLHCHTTASDGLLTPCEVVKLAVTKGLRAIGITDHDTIKGWPEAEKVASENGIELLKGIELNTDWQGTEVHILGYELDGASPYLTARLKELRVARYNRIIKIVESLNKDGLNITLEEVMGYAKGDSVGRPHVAQALINNGYAENTKDAFDRYIGPDAPAYIPRYKLSPQEGIRLVREAGGVAVLAHPGVHRLDKSISSWVRKGLQGIEVFHSEHGKEDELNYKKLAEQYNLITTGGSDFHGEQRRPGVILGGWGVQIDVVHTIRALANKNKKSLMNSVS